MSGRPVLVTGATGFLGRALLRRLASAGRSVIAVVRPSSDVSRLSGALVEVHDGTAQSLRAVFARHRPDTVFHLAAAGVSNEANIDEIIHANVLLGAQLTDAAVKTGVERLLVAGTFFTRRGGTRDYDPVSLYAAAKRAFEVVLDAYARTTSLRAASICLYDLYGPNDTRPKLLNLLAEGAKTGEELALSPGEQILDMLHVDDAASAFLRAETALDAPVQSGLREWCASSGERLSVRALVDLFRQATGLAPKVKFGGRPYREREVMAPWIGESVPGWKPAIPLKEGLRRVYGAAARMTGLDP